ncbi:MAG: hypothetical protein RIS17_8 [Pseudomonadota bacterium]
MSAAAPILPTANAAEALAFLVAAGCDVAVDDVPRQWLAAPPEPVAAPEPIAAAPRPKAPPAPPPSEHPALACADVPALLALLGRFPDARTRPPLLFDGAIDSGIWVLIDRPDADIDHRSTITRMLDAIDLDWTKAALVSRLQWPTPGDGEPTPQALARFTPVVERLAALAPPRHILALGQIAAEIAGPDARRASSRGQWFDWAGAKLLPSIHPRTFAGNIELKRQAFEHLKAFKAALA